MNKKKTIIGIIIAVVVIIIIAVAAFFIAVPSSKAFNGTKPISFIVKKNEKVNDVLNGLSMNGTLKDSTFKELYTNVTGENFDVTPGVYTINPNVTTKQLLTVLKEQKTITVVIPEGATVTSIANIFDTLGMFTQSDFLNAVKNYPLPEYIKPIKGQEYALQGYLFPTTYHFNKGESANEVIKTMVLNFVTSLDRAQANTKVKITPAQINTVLTRASVIQALAKTNEDIDNASTQLVNDLKNKQPIGIDSLGTTLPTAPICNPSEKAIEASLKTFK
ncbi:MAG: endolytic transglycosylase MltG [Clostridium sp.]|uniref:endolytic transglycosylase MltG n=1 Tax=Clostridium sp. TaxID=1506 RepID=UPI003F3BC7F7